MLTDPGSPEWRWLRRELDLTVDAIRGDGTRVAMIVNPLRSQVAPDDPLLLQTLVTRYASERGLACLDLLPPPTAPGQGRSDASPPPAPGSPTPPHG